MRSYLFSTFITLLFVSSTCNLMGQKPRIPTGGSVAVVVDERLSALRSKPSVSAPLELRLSRGRFVAIVGSQRSPEGLIFFDVKISRRKRGWLQAGAVVSLSRAADDD